MRSITAKTITAATRAKKVKKETNSPRTLNQKEAQLQATVTSWAIYGAAMRWSTGDRSETAPAFARRALPLIMAGLSLPPESASKARTTARK